MNSFGFKHTQSENVLDFTKEMEQMTPRSQCSGSTELLFLRAWSARAPSYWTSLAEALVGQEFCLDLAGEAWLASALL